MPSMRSPLSALSPLDGRYAKTLDPLRAHFSEHALIRYRVRIELEAGHIVRVADDGTEESLALPPVPEFLREVLREGSVLAFFQRHGRFPGEERPV